MGHCRAGVRIVRGMLVLFFSAAGLGGLDAVLYWRYLRATWKPLPPRSFAQPVRYVPYRTLLRLGWQDKPRESSFTHFDMRKRPGVVRIGCLGDSFTYGSEVSSSEDYPNVLQRLFRERGYSQVEVLNFGSGWYGFQQTFILWEDVARRFDLDYVVLGPKTFFFARDTTFDHVSPNNIHYLHARSVLDGEGLRIVEIAGDTFGERTAAYRRFVPHWRYLRYDYRAPAFLACLVPRGKEIRNPFYYRRDITGELAEVYRRQLRRMADSGVQIVLGHYDNQDILQIARSLGRSNLFATGLKEIFSYPYRAPKGHGSPSGNELLAEQFFAILTGRGQTSLPLITIKPLKRLSNPSARGSPEELDSYARISVGLDGGDSWRFVEIMSGTLTHDLQGDFLRKRHLKALLALKTSDQLLPEAVFYPLSMGIHEGMKLSLRSAQGEFILGNVSLLRADLQVGVVDLRGGWKVSPPGFKNIDAIYKARGVVEKLLPGKVYLGDQAVFSLNLLDRRGNIGLHPNLRRFLQIYSPSRLKGWGGRSGLVTLRFESEGGKAISVPLAAWKRAARDLTVRFDEPGIARPLARSGR